VSREPITPDSRELDDGPLLRTPCQDWQFAAARELRDRIHELVIGVEERQAEGWRLVPGTLGSVMAGTFARGTQTYRAVLLLCDRGYGEQAGMLNRSLFEYAVTAWWMLGQPEDEVMDGLRKHHDHARVLYERALDTHPELKPGREQEAEPLAPEYVAELDAAFSRFGGQWHGKRLDQIVRESAANFDDEAYADVVWKFFRFVNHWNNYMLHHSSVSLSEGVRWSHPEAPPEIVLGPNSKWGEPSLWAGFWMYGLLVQATLKHHELDALVEFRAFFDERAARFVSVTAEMAKGIGRNDLCPCSSGLKFKRCHEPFVGAT
jgi:hypothetical protein